MARKIHDYKIFGNHAYYTPGISGMIALFGWFILGSILGSVLAALLTPIGMGDYAFMLAYVVSFIPAMMFAASRGVRNAGFDTGYVLDNNNFAPVNGWVLAAMVIVGTLAMSYISDFFTSLLPPMPDFLKEAMEKLTQDSPLWVSFITVSLMAPFFEEWLCRGMVLRGLLHYKHTLRVSTPTEEEALAGVKPGDVVTRHGLKPVWALIISAVFFAVLHMNPWQGIAAFLLGGVVGTVVIVRGADHRRSEEVLHRFLGSGLLPLLGQGRVKNLPLSAGSQYHRAKRQYQTKHLFLAHGSVLPFRSFSLPGRGHFASSVYLG